MRSNLRKYLTVDIFDSIHEFIFHIFMLELMISTFWVMPIHTIMCYLHSYIFWYSYHYAPQGLIMKWRLSGYFVDEASVDKSQPFDTTGRLNVIWSHYSTPHPHPYSHPSAAYIRRRTGPALVQVMARRLFGAKPSPETVLVYCRLDPSVKIESKYNIFHSRKCIWKYLRNGGHLVIEKTS